LLAVFAAGVLLAAGAASRASGAPEVPGRAGLAEHAGGFLPADIVAVDERGATVRLADLTDRPVILSLVYYSCEHVCPLVLGALGELVSNMDLAAGRDYRLVTLSFDATDGAGDAARAKANYTQPLRPALPEGAWSFLTASDADIAELTEAIGFRFERTPHGFIHPSVLVILGPGGRISSYFHVSRTAYGVGYPVVFSPVTMAAALRQAGAAGTAGPDPAPLLFCFPHEPPAQSRFYGLMKTTGIGTLVLMTGLFLYLSMAWKRPRAGREGP
jgi:protein SCO1/2